MKTYPVLKEALHHLDIWICGGIAPHMLNLGTRWRWVVTFIPWQLYPHGKSSQYPLNGRLGGPQRVWMHWQREKIPVPVRNLMLVIQPIA